MKKTTVTKEKLQEYGFTSIVWDNISNEWIIMRHWRPNKKEGKIFKTIKVRTIHNNPKYAPKSYYKAISFSYGKQKITLALQRVIYAWFVGPVTTEYDVDHIDRDTFNNRLDNLRLLTHSENMKTRYLKINQHYYIKKEAK